MERDDIFEYSLLNHHSEEEGVKKRKKLWGVFWLLLVVTIVEVGLGLMFSRTPSMKNTLFITFIVLTIVKAMYIVLTFMHLGDETKSFKYTVLVPFILFVLYLVFICITEANYTFNMDTLFNWNTLLK
jgi:cytochrome c oxidase subunit IV